MKLPAPEATATRVTRTVKSPFRDEALPRTAHLRKRENLASSARAQHGARRFCSNTARSGSGEPFNFGSDHAVF